MNEFYFLIPRDSPDYAMLQKLCFQDYNYTAFYNSKPRFEGDTVGNFIIRVSAVYLN